MFRRRARLVDYIFLFSGLYLLIYNITGFFRSRLGVANVLWGALGALIIYEVFRRLEKKSSMGISTTGVSDPTPSSSSPTNNQMSKNFWNYFPIILLFINVILAILAWSYTTSEIGLGVVYLFLHIALMVLAIPPVVFAFLGRFKKTANVLSFLFLAPAIVAVIFLFVIIPISYKNNVANIELRYATIQSTTHIPLAVDQSKVLIDGNNVIRVIGINRTDLYTDFERVFTDKVINAGIPIQVKIAPGAYSVDFIARPEDSQFKLKNGEHYLLIEGDVTVNGETVNEDWVKKNL